MASELLSAIRAEIDARMRELAPALAECERLNAAVAALEAEARAPAARPAPSVPARASRAGSTAAGTRSRARAASPRADAATPTRAGATTSRASTAGGGSGAGGEGAPAPAATRSRGGRGAREGARARGARGRGGRRTRERPADSPVGRAILAALEHGSHTVAELVMVTALPVAEVRAGVRALLVGGVIAKTEREGKAAYALPGLGD